MINPLANQRRLLEGISLGTFFLMGGVFHFAESPRFFLFPQAAVAQPLPHEDQIDPDPSAQFPPVLSIAQQVTVRIFTNPGAGSGVLIAHQGQTYTVLTCDHVANSSTDQTYRILTHDGKIYTGQRHNTIRFQGLDVALVQFESLTLYPVVRLGNLDATMVGEPIYIAGFPNYQPRDGNNLDITYDWGIKAFQLSEGSLTMLLSERSLLRGYQLAYSNETSSGMSGGAVLNQQGELIGIHGRGKPVLQGIEAFQLADGTFPEPILYEQMAQFSWAIPISRIWQRMDNFPTSTEPLPPPPVPHNEPSEAI